MRIPASHAARGCRDGALVGPRRGPAPPRRGRGGGARLARQTRIAHVDPVQLPWRCEPPSLFLSEYPSSPAAGRSGLQVPAIHGRERSSSGSRPSAQVSIVSNAGPLQPLTADRLRREDPCLLSKRRESDVADSRRHRHDVYVCITPGQPSCMRPTRLKSASTSASRDQRVEGASGGVLDSRTSPRALRSESESYRALPRPRAAASAGPPR